jgi:hypothetical protein
MVIEGTEYRYSKVPPEQLADYYLFPALSTQGTHILDDTPTTTVSANTYFRSSMRLATGRDYFVSSGPVEVTARGKRPPGSQLYSLKGCRRGMQQNAGYAGMSNLQVRIICDWNEGDAGARMMDRYAEFDVDIRLWLFRLFYGVPNPPPMLYCPYQGKRPRNLAVVGVVPIDSLLALREWAHCKVLSAIPTYDRGTTCDAATDVSRMKQFIVFFKQRPEPVPGTFSIHPITVFRPIWKPIVIATLSVTIHFC